MLLDQILPHCALHSLAPKGDERGSLVALEALRDFPFEIRRVYFVYDTAPGVARGFHSHKALQQWAVCVSGQCRFVVDDCTERREVMLDRPDRALYIGPGVWREMHDFSPGAVLMVLASLPYDEADYIRDYEEFRRLARKEAAE